jgi:hypothetical protein
MKLVLTSLVFLETPHKSLCLTLFNTLFLGDFFDSEDRGSLGASLFLRLLFGFQLLKCVKKKKSNNLFLVSPEIRETATVFFVCLQQFKNRNPPELWKVLLWCIIKIKFLSKINLGGSKTFFSY